MLAIYSTLKSRYGKGWVTLLAERLGVHENTIRYVAKHIEKGTEPREQMAVMSKTRKVYLALKKQIGEQA